MKPRQRAVDELDSRFRGNDVRTTLANDNITWSPATNSAFKHRISMGLIQDEDAVEIRQRLRQMVGPVKIAHFTQELNLELGAETLQLLKELSALSDKLTLQVFNFLLDQEKVEGSMPEERFLDEILKAARAPGGAAGEENEVGTA